MKRALALAALLLSLSCSRKPAGESAQAPGGESAAASRTVVIAVPEEPDQLVPPFARSPASAAIWPWILPSLVRVETDSLRRARTVPDAAASWQFEDGGRAVRFFVNGARLWQDTTAVGPADVVETYRLYRDAANGPAWARRIEEIASVEEPAGAPGTVLFRFRRPLSHERALALASLPVISATQLAKSKDRKPLLGSPGRLVHCAGPFRVDEWKAGDFLRLVRHPFAPEERVPRAETIILRFAAVARSRSLQLQEGVVDLAIDLPAEEVNRLREEDARDVRLVRAGPVSFEALVWNLDHPIWGSRELRRAVCATLDLRSLRRAAAGADSASRDESAAGFLVTAADSTGPADTTSVRAFGNPSLELLYDAADPRRERIAIEAAMQLDRLGVACRLLPLPASDGWTRIANRRFDAAVIDWGLPALHDLGDVWGSRGADNVAGLADAAVDSLIEKARSPAADTIADPWTAVDRRARADLPCVGIARRVRVDGLGPRLAGYRPDPAQPYGDLLSIARRAAAPARERGGGKR